MIFPGSRYKGVPYSAIKLKDEKIVTVLHQRQFVKREDIGENFIIYEVQEGDELDLLAYKFGGKARLWWLIADINELDYPWTLKRGQKLIIPSIEEFAKR
ncbi:MAG: LysM domain-containing protein [Elusimicrobiota bacterium]